MGEAAVRVRTLLERPEFAIVREASGDSEAYVVGGTVRDALSERRQSADIDIVIERAVDIAPLVAKRLDGRLIRMGGSRHEVWRILTAAGQIDLHAPFAATLDAELRRRDLTINAIAVALSDGRIHDPVGGLEDLENQLLRAPTSSAFLDDPLRVLRLTRFAIELPGFSIEQRTLELAHQAHAELDSVAAERVREELHRIITGSAVWLDSKLASTGLFPFLWRAPGQGPAEVGAVPLAGPKSSNLYVVATRLGHNDDDFDEALRHAALLVGAAGRMESASAQTLVARGWVSNRLGAHIERILEPYPFPGNRLEERRLMHHFGPAWAPWLALRWQQDDDDAFRRWDSLCTRLARTAHDHGQELFEPRPLLDGDRIQQEFGVVPGPALGTLIANLVDAQVDGAVGTVDEARRFLARRLAEGMGFSTEIGEDQGEGS